VGLHIYTCIGRVGKTAIVPAYQNIVNFKEARVTFGGSRFDILCLVAESSIAFSGFGTQRFSSIGIRNLQPVSHVNNSPLEKFQFLLSYTEACLSHSPDADHIPYLSIELGHINEMAPPSAIEVEAITDTSAITMPDPLSAPIKSNDILGRRQKSDRRQWGVAAPADTSHFRLKSYEGKPKARRWDRSYFSSKGVVGG